RSHDRAGLAEALVARGRLDEARAFADDALAEARARHPEAHPDIAAALMVEARLLAAGGDRERASALAGDAGALYDPLEGARPGRATAAPQLPGDPPPQRARAAAAPPTLRPARAPAAARAPAVPALAARLRADLRQLEPAPPQQDDRIAH